MLTSRFFQFHFGRCRWYDFVVFDGRGKSSSETKNCVNVTPLNASPSFLRSKAIWGKVDNVIRRRCRNPMLLLSTCNSETGRSLKALAMTAARTSIGSDANSTRTSLLARRQSSVSRVGFGCKQSNPTATDNCASWNPASCKYRNVASWMVSMHWVNTSFALPPSLELRVESAIVSIASVITKIGIEALGWS